MAYFRISLAGDLGSGKSTVGSILKEKFYADIISIGKIQREMAEKLGMDTTEFNVYQETHPELDKELDDKLASYENKEGSFIFDSRMAWHFACDSFKVFMHIDPAIAARRVMADDRGEVEKYTDLDDARRQLLARAMSENTRYKRIYGADNLDYRNFDLIVDSATITPEMLAELILDEFGKYSADPAAYSSPRLRLSPLAIYPTASEEEMAREEGDITVTVINGSHYLTGGGRALLDAIREKPATVAARLADDAGKAEAEARISALGKNGAVILRGIGDKWGFEYPEIPEVYR